MIGSPKQLKVNNTQDLQSGVNPVAAYSVATGVNTDEQIARLFLNYNRAYLRLDNPDSELSLNRQESDDLNRRHIRFNQNYQGLPVWPAELVVHLDPQGSVDLVNGAFIPTPNTLITKPVVSTQAALTAARAYAPGSEEANASQPELIVYGALDRPARLACKLELDISIGSHWVVVVDALNGQILTAFDNVAHENLAGSGQDLLGDTKPLNVWRENNVFYLVGTSKPMFDPSSDPPQSNTTRGAITVNDARNQPLSKDLKPPEFMQKLNHRPRKTLNYKTPHAVFFGDDNRKAA